MKNVEKIVFFAKDFRSSSIPIIELNNDLCLLCFWVYYQYIHNIHF